ncbi:L-lactate permease [Planctomicrobium piriforme]|uniref:L-lactate permease n=1 Tax=Planctomicrobium piriforme TaxID=1576369 RepID=A0A1I3FHE4_9PLAN|nr:lactate permease LctP family transporter [Planctomicrobium piriforme]SFI10522.1 lactate permease [Planctomicrobium piriforme]
MDWVQIYDPFGSPFWSTLMAMLPTVALLGLLTAGFAAPRSALLGLLTALGVAIWGYGMPASAALAATFYGAVFGLLPIGWIVVAAVFLFHLTVKTGQFEVVKHSVAALSPDRRVQALLIAFCFGTFIEGAAGFGTPVAICAALMIGLGFSPLYAAGLALIANTSPVAFGALGTPIITLAKVSGLDEMALSQMAGRQLPFFSLIVPAWLVATMSGWRGVVGCWPAIVVCGGTFAALQFVISNFHGPALVDVVGGLGSMVALAVLLRFWQPPVLWRFPDEPAESTAAAQTFTRRQVMTAWMPWIFLSLFVFLWGWPPIKTALNGGTSDKPNVLAGYTKWSFPMPGLHQRIYRTAPVAPVPVGSDRAAESEKAILEIPWLGTTGTGIFLAAILTGLWLRIPVKEFIAQFRRTLWEMRWALFTIAAMLALAFTTKYSGADATLGLAFTHTGALYPFFAPLLGWLGVALTGSDTSSNALFGSLQRITAEQLGLNPILIVASNSTGGVMGKMIDAQSIVVAAVATEQTGGEGQILRFVFLHSVVLAVLVGALTLAQAYVLTWMIPG